MKGKIAKHEKEKELITKENDINMINMMIEKDREINKLKKINENFSQSGKIIKEKDEDMMKLRKLLKEKAQEIEILSSKINERNDKKFEKEIKIDYPLKILENIQNPNENCSIFFFR